MRYKFGERVRGILELQSNLDQSVKTQTLENGWIEYSLFVKVFNETQKHDDPECKSILWYLSDMTPVFSAYEKPEPKPKSREFTKLMERLRAEQDEKDYRILIGRNKNGMAPGNMENELIRNEVDEVGKYKFLKDADIVGSQRSNDIGSQAKEVKHQITTIFNIMITVGSVGYAVWYWSGSSMRLGNGTRVLLSLFFSILVLIAEVVVFGSYLRKIDEAKIKEKGLVEKKQVIETLVIGKGKNGGSVRQRKRSKKMGSSDVQLTPK